MIIGIARSGFVDTDTGEFQEQRLVHREDAEKFYRALTGASQVVRIGDVSTTVSV